MVYIEDGQGTGRKAAVTSENRLDVRAITHSAEHHANQSDGVAYNYMMTETPAASGAAIIYIKNSDEKDLILEGMQIMNQETQMYELSMDDTGTPAGTVTVTPANMNGGAGQVADGNFYTGSGIAGLTQGTIIDRIWQTAGSGTSNHNFEMDVVIPKNQTFVVRTGITGSKTNITIPMYYHD